MTNYDGEDFPGVPELKIDFKAGGELAVAFRCESEVAGEKTESSTGNWWIEADRLCMKSDGEKLNGLFSSHGSCWAIGPGEFNFAVYDEGGGPVFANLKVDHSKYRSKDGLLAALDTVEDQPFAQSVTPPAPPSPQPEPAAVQTAATETAPTAQTAPAVPAADGSASVDEAERLKQEAEMARLKQEAEMARLRQEAERLKQEAEMARLRQEAERLKREAEMARLKEEAERARQQAELERIRREAEASAQLARARDREAEERQLWASIRNTRKMSALEDYLQHYPDGRYHSEAEARLGVLEKFRAVEGIEFGRYHALVIGIDDYRHLPKLATAVNDAKVVAGVLKDDYGFKVTLLLNPTRDGILDAFDEFQEKLGADDNLLIYYAGHGWLNEDSSRGYWLPTDAKPNRRSRWMSNATVTDTLKTFQAKHVMVVADSCYSGTLTRSANIGLRTGDYWKRMAGKQARVALVSGGLEPVADAGSGGHSPFAKAFIDVLRTNDAVMDGTQLFSKLRRPVMVSAQQTPEHPDVRNAGHDGGDFLFVRKY